MILLQTEWKWDRLHRTNFLMERKKSSCKVVTVYHDMNTTYGIRSGRNGKEWLQLKVHTSHPFPPSKQACSCLHILRECIPSETSWFRKHWSLHIFSYLQHLFSFSCALRLQNSIKVYVFEIWTKKSCNESSAWHWSCGSCCTYVLLYKQIWQVVVLKSALEPLLLAV